MKTNQFIVLAMAAMMSMSACSKAQKTETAAEPANAPAAAADMKEKTAEACRPATDKTIDAAAWADANNALALSMLKANKGTTVASSYSVERALGMVLEGACGDTAKEMQTALALPEAKNLSETGKAVEKGLLGELGEHVEIRIDNRVWLDGKYKVLDTYAKTLKDNYSAELVPVDFIKAPEEARGTINAHVAKATSDKIKDILPQGSVTSDTKLVLTNAVYFKAPWQHAFTPDKTAKADFTTAAGPVKVDMMHNTKSYMYTENDKVQAIGLGFAESPYMFLVVLPKVAEGQNVDEALTAVENGMTAASLRDLTKALDSRQIELSLPKFRVEADTPLKALLQKLGMKAAFSKADFSGISGSTDLYISDVFHKAYIDINELGAEAAAATAAIMMMRAMPNREPAIKVSVDHPFMFAIMDTQTNTALFMGRKTTF